MEKEKNLNPGEALLREIYKNANMGEDALNSLISRATDENLRRDITHQLEMYAGFADKAKCRLYKMNIKPKEINPMAKISSEISMTMSTMADSSAGKLAGMIIEGATMGIVELKKQITAAKNENAPADITDLANDVVKFEENSINKMKAYL